MSGIEIPLVIVGGNAVEWGYIPTFLDTNDPRPAVEQIDANYVGGWSDFKGFDFDYDSLTLHYKGDPPIRPLSALLFRREMLLLYPHAWVLILQPDRSWQIARLD
jgi:hypothetical protein